MHPVAIVGGGPVGLVSSILLSLRKIPHILFERYPSTSIHPKACGFNQRTIEIFRQIGIENEVLQQRAPPDTVSRTAWYTSLGPEGREIVGRDAWGGGQYQEEYQKTSPSPYVVLPQIRLEPILQHRAQLLNPEGLHYGKEVTKVEEKQDHVLLTINHKGTTFQVEAAYCIGADGGRGMTETLGIGWEGERDIVDMISAHIRAPISLHHPDERNFITWFINPALGGSIGTGYLYHLGPYPSSPESEEWLFACALNPDDPKRFDKDAILTRLHNTLQIPDLPVELLSLSRWSVNALCATTYRTRPRNDVAGGRIFLVGDAAHRIPPWGALGLNTGIQDAHNLIWKLAFTITRPPSLHTATYNALLSTYDTERRPIGRRVGLTSLANLRSHSSVMDTALGITPSNTAVTNKLAMAAYFDTTNVDAGAARRSAVQKAQKALDSEFHALGAEVGWFYPNLDVENEGLESRRAGQVDKSGKLVTLTYHPSTIPGHHLPHSWIERGEGVKISTRDLVRVGGGFVVVVGSRGGTWGRIVEAAGLDEQVVRVERVLRSRGEDGDEAESEEAWRDADGTWGEVCGISETGAVLVRPDGIVAWRAQSDTEIRALGQSEAREWFRTLIRWVLKIDGEKQKEAVAKESGGVFSMLSGVGEVESKSGRVEMARL